MNSERKLVQAKSGNWYYSYYQPTKARRRQRNEPRTASTAARWRREDDGSCQICGGNNNLNAHHIDREGRSVKPNPDNSPANLITL